MTLGYFESVVISTHRASSDDLLDLEVEVRERSTDTLQVGGGLSSTDSFLVQGQVAMQNLLGRGQSRSGQVQLSGVRRLFALHFTDPHFLDSPWTFGAELCDQAVRSGAYARTSTGAALTLGHPLGDRLHGFVTYRLENVGIASGFGGFAGLGATASQLRRATPRTCCAAAGRHRSAARWPTTRATTACSRTPARTRPPTPSTPAGGPDPTTRSAGPAGRKLREADSPTARCKTTAMAHSGVIEI